MKVYWLDLDAYMYYKYLVEIIICKEVFEMLTKSCFENVINFSRMYLTWNT